MTTPEGVILTEVGPRDGLQNEPGIVPVERKIAFVNALTACGLTEIEVTAFVSSRWVPQLADATEVLEKIDRRDGVTYSALVPNLEGWQRASDVGVDKIAVFTAASETFSQHNTNTDIAGTLTRFEPVIRSAHAVGCQVRGYVSCAVACPYEGSVDPGDVRDLVKRLLDIGVDEIDLGDTIGVAVPSDIDRLLEVVGEVLSPAELVLHLHDTGGRALACCRQGMESGVYRFDTSCGGLGGCPYAPGASGNLATEDLVRDCMENGIETGIHAEGLAQARELIKDVIDRNCSGDAPQAGL